LIDVISLDDVNMTSQASDSAAPGATAAAAAPSANTNDDDVDDIVDKASVRPVSSEAYTARRSISAPMFARHTSIAVTS
jgi:hypothetical protein